MLASHKTIKVLAIIHLLLVVQQALDSYCVSFPGDCTSSPSYNTESVNQNDKQPVLGHDNQRKPQTCNPSLLACC